MNILLLLMALASAPAVLSAPELHLKAWDIFKTLHNRTYSDATEETSRKKVFLGNMLKIEAQDPKGHKVGINKFADLTIDEFNANYKGFVVSPAEKLATDVAYAKYLADNTIMKLDDDLRDLFRYKRAAVPDNFDWRSVGAVSYVKDQGGCSSCWTFATTGALESQIFIKKNKTVSLSPQNILDCATSGNGCSGGGNKIAYNYIKANGGLNSFMNYPYQAIQGTCRYNASNIAGMGNGYIQSTQFDEIALKNSVYVNGPHSIAIDSTHPSLQFYKNGIYYEPACSSSKLDHSVIVVGYGTDVSSGADYWIVKNSWGTGWGMNGFFYLARNKNNHCGPATYATCPVV